jgi:hypothetical protein
MRRRTGRWRRIEVSIALVADRAAERPLSSQDASALVLIDDARAFSRRARARRAEVEPTGHRLFKWTVSRSLNILDLYDGGLSYHLTERAARRKARRWLARDPLAGR